MKKLVFLSILFSLFLFSCKEEPEPDPELIRAYCYLYHFIPGLENVNWIVNDIEIPNAQYYTSVFPAAVELSGSSEEVTFTAKHAGSGAILESQAFTLEENKYYTLIISGPELEPVLLFREVDTSRPTSGNVKFQLLHAAIFKDSIDVYMGGTTPDKRVVADLDFKELSEPFEARDYDARAAISITVHDSIYKQDNVLLTSVYNDVIVSGANYMSVVAPSTVDPLSKLTIWIYDLPLE